MSFPKCDQHRDREELEKATLTSPRHTSKSQWSSTQCLSRLLHWIWQMIKKLFSKLCSGIENLHLYNIPWVIHRSTLLQPVTPLTMRQTFKHMAAFNKIAVKLCIFHFTTTKCIGWYLFSNWNLLSFFPETFFLKM